MMVLEKRRLSVAAVAAGIAVLMSATAFAFVEPSRGVRRLWDVAAIPVFDAGACIEYEGSIDRGGGNADWDWGCYQDENGEWVLAEDEGAGCLFNFTQHRYLHFPVTFKFYFNGVATPCVTLTPADFGRKPPFLHPLAGAFVPNRNLSGDRDFAIVRSFVPMEYTNGFKVTSSIPLRNRNPGGWGHVLYHRYADAQGIGTFCPEACDLSLGRRAACLRMKSSRTIRKGKFCVPSRGTVALGSLSGRGALSEIALTVGDFRATDLTNVWVSLEFDGERTCEAPIGTFFGCESSAVKTNLETALLSFDIRSSDARFSNRFPMPYFATAKVILENRGSSPLSCAAEISVSDAVDYDMSRTGIFRATKYLPPTSCVDGMNTLIGAAQGRGQLAYAVLTGRKIKYGCEGDVRLYLDRFATPAVQSDGTESWGSWGWGFCAPAQTHLFSAYSGVYDFSKHPYHHAEWSLLRLMHLDSCPFRRAFRFELEHGRDNHGGGFHSGQVFYYAINPVKRS